MTIFIETDSGKEYRATIDDDHNGLFYCCLKQMTGRKGDVYDVEVYDEYVEGYSNAVGKIMKRVEEIVKGEGV